MKKIIKGVRLPFLFIIDDPSLESDIKEHLHKSFNDFKIAFTPDEAEKICRIDKPRVLLIGCKSLSASEHIYLNLIKKVKEFENHRTILMIKASESKAAFKLCMDEVFNDYIVINPLYDKESFNIGILRALEVLDENKGLEKLAEIESMLRKLQQSNNQHKRVEQSIHKKARNIQKQLSEALAEQADGLAQNIGNELTQEENQDIQTALSNFKASLTDSISMADSDMDKALNDWEKELNAINQDLDAGLNQTIKATGITRRVLVIEDDKLYSNIIINVLKSSNYQTESSFEAKLGLAKIERFNPDLIILDWNLPDLSGADVLKSIKSNIPTAHIPVIILTGHSQPGIVKKAIALGANDFIVKPSNKDFILSKVDSALFLKSN